MSDEPAGADLGHQPSGTPSSGAASPGAASSGSGARRAEALATLHDLHATVLWRYAISLTRNAVEAEDVVQETLLRAWRNERLLAEDPEAVRGWLFTVARNLVIDDARSARRRRERSSATLPGAVDGDRTDRLFDAMVLSDALASLGDAHREVITRAYYGGLSTNELAQELGIAEGTVKSRLHYGLRALRLAFQERGITR